MRKRTVREIKCIVAFLVAFSFCATAGEIACRKIPFLQYAYPVERDCSRSFQENYLDIGLVSHKTISHWIMFLGIGHAIEQARKADIVILGNSLSLFAFPQKIMDAFSKSTGTSYYNLSFGHGESMVFPTAVMKKHHIEPEIAIVHADMFFSRKESSYAETILATDSFEEFKKRVEIGTSYYLFRNQRMFPHFFPYVPPPIRRGAITEILFRDVKTGSWNSCIKETTTRLVCLECGRSDLSDQEIENAVQFKKFLDDMGCAMIITHIPSTQPKTSTRRARKIAAYLNVPFITYESSDMETFDDEHLTRKSAIRFSKAFLEQFKESEPFLRLLQEKS